MQTLFEFFSFTCSWFRGLSFRGKLMTLLLPPVISIILLTGYLDYRLSHRFLDIVLKRNVRIQTLAMAHEIQNLFEVCRNTILFIAQDRLDPAALRNHLARSTYVQGIAFRELALLQPDSDEHLYFVTQEDAVATVPATSLALVRPNPLLLFESLGALQPGEVAILPAQEVEHQITLDNGAMQTVASQLIRFVTPVIDPLDNRTQALVLSIDARDVRDILSLFNSSRSPIYPFTRSEEVRFAYFFDTDGWMLFQSEPLEKVNPLLATYLARSGFEGTLSKPGMASAFRPNSVYPHYWKMVSDIRQNKSDVIVRQDGANQSKNLKTYYFSYAPVLFSRAPGQEPQVIGGLAFIDRSQLFLVAGYRHLDVTFLVTLSTVLLVSLLIVVVSHLVMRPMRKLTNALEAVDTASPPADIDLPYQGYEMNMLQNAANKLLQTLREQMGSIRLKDDALRAAESKKRVSFEEQPCVASNSFPDPFPEIIGIGPKIDQLKSDIVKAARVDVDVLILGETGTGKQLTAEAIHRLSARAKKPFISINCGELDENLLLDTLFGHTKGAFTQAHTDRNGAFLEADGGTLFLDEIQSASARVQQSLLRAIAARKVKPLGSDKEVDVDVRLIAATNADLTRLIEERQFREDLYFRLKVITITIPPLREHPDSVPALALAYLRRAERMTGKSGIGFSRGALESLKLYHWPGNIRELINCITRAAVMVDQDIIHDEDLHLECMSGASSEPGEQYPQLPTTAYHIPAPPPIPPAEENITPQAPPAKPDHGSGLNQRQRKAMPQILGRGRVTRTEYEEIVGRDLSSRTAIYDLQDLVRKGLLEKTGRGPATMYVPTASALGSPWEDPS